MSDFLGTMIAEQVRFNTMVALVDKKPLFHSSFEAYQSLRLNFYDENKIYLDWDKDAAWDYQYINNGKLYTVPFAKFQKLENVNIEDVLRILWKVTFVLPNKDTFPFSVMKILFKTNNPENKKLSV